MLDPVTYSSLICGSSQIDSICWLCCENVVIVWHATENGEEPEQLLLTTYELADMSVVFNVPEVVLFSVLRDVLTGDEWIDQPQVVSTLQAPLLRLCARYLYAEKKRGYALNPVGKLPFVCQYAVKLLFICRQLLISLC